MGGGVPVRIEGSAAGLCGTCGTVVVSFAMTRWFNIAGPCIASQHYMVPAEGRAGEAQELIAQGRWFALVSGRQTGKTTVARWLRQDARSRREGVVLWIDVEEARDQPDPARAFRTLLGVIGDAAERDIPGFARWSQGELETWLLDPASALRRCLRRLCEATPRLTVIFDEADVFAGPTMVSFLTQLRALYLDRDEAPAPWSVVLAGVRSVRDYVVGADERRAVPWLGTASPFNVAVENVGLAAFTPEEVVEFIGQHTAETGQGFESAAIDHVMNLSNGHPWLVNALADQATRRDVKDRAVAITAEHIESAKETIILERRTHIDSLLARLREDRVRRVLDPMLAGERAVGDTLDDDFAYVVGLGLIRKVNGAWEIANRIYREVIPRALVGNLQDQLVEQAAWYVGDDGLLDVPKLMAAWQTFWRKDGHLAAEGFSYKESGPHLMLMAFLQRVVNGGGTIEREYALGKGALDLLVTWKTQRIAIEVKMRRDTETEDDALEQVCRYLASLGMSDGWMVLFDLRSTAPWGERLFTRERVVGGYTVRVVGC